MNARPVGKMVSSVLLKQLVILLISVVIGTKGQGWPLGSPVGLYGGGLVGGINENQIRQRIEECGHRYNGNAYICYGTQLRDFHCIAYSQLCDGYRDCYGGDDEQGCGNSRSASSYSFTTTTTTVTPTSTSISTEVSTSITKETGSTTTTTTSTSTVLETSTVQVRFLYGQSSTTLTSTQTFIVGNVLMVSSVPAGVTLASGIYTCTSTTIPIGGTSLAGDNDYLFVTDLITRTLAAQATLTCTPTATTFH